MRPRDVLIQSQNKVKLVRNSVRTKVRRLSREKAFFSTDLREMQRKRREVNQSAGSGLSNAAGNTAVHAAVAVVGGGWGLDMKVHLEILPGVSAARLLPGLCSINGLQGTKHQVLQLQGLHQVSVPDHSWAHKAAVKDNRMQPVSAQQGRVTSVLNGSGCAQKQPALQTSSNNRTQGPEEPLTPVKRLQML